MRKEVDVYNGQQLREQLVANDEAGHGRVVVNLDAVEFLDSTGLAVLIGGRKRARGRHGDLALVFARRPLLEVLLEFTRRLITLRREHPAFRRRRWFQGRPIRGTVDLGWSKPDGTEMNDDDWDAGFARSVGLFLNGEVITGRDPRGQRITDDSFLLLFNAHHEPIDWTLPKHWGDQWDLILDTADDSRTTDHHRRPLGCGVPPGRPGLTDQ